MRGMKFLVTFLFTALFGSILLAGAEARLKNLSEEQFRAAGLHKLTPAELAALEALIADQKAVAEPATPAKTGPKWFQAMVTLSEVADRPEAAEALESQLVGEFSGWEGKAVFRLKNGQIWQQNDTSTRAERPRMEPKVRIFPGLLGAYWMEIEGIKQRVKVKPIKLQ